MSSINIDVDTAVTLPVNAVGLVDDTDFKTPEEAIAYNASGMDLEWHFITSAGVYSVTSVTPTTGGGDYDWSHSGNAKYKIGVPASGGASINNDAEGYGWFEGQVTGVLPFRSPTFRFRAASVNDALCDGGDLLDVNATEISGDSTAADNLELAYDGTGYDVGGIDVSELNQIVDDLLNGGRLDLLVDAIKAKTDNLAFTTAGKVDARVDYVGTNAVTSPDDFKATGFATPTNVTDAQTAIVTEINANETKIDSIITTIGVAGAGLSAIAWNPAWDAEVQSEVDDGLKALGLENALIAQGAVRSVSVDSSHRVYSHVYEMQPNTLTASALAADAVAEIQDGLSTATKVLNYVRLLARKDSAVATDLATELGEINADTGTGTGTYSNNDSQESIRDNASSLDAAGVRDAVGLAAANLDTQLGAIAGDTGSGANSITPTVTDGTDPLESAKVRFTKGAESYLQSTNASGTFSTPFALDNGTWTVAITLPGYTFGTTTLVVTGNATPTYAMTATGLSVPDSPRIRARLLVLDKTTKEGKSGVELQVTVTDAAFADGYASEATTITVTSDANGLAEWYALPGESYKITGENVSSTVTVPRTATDPHSVKSVLV